MPKRIPHHTPERKRPDPDAAALACVAGEIGEAIRPATHPQRATLEPGAVLLAPIRIGPDGALVFDFSGGQFPRLDVIRRTAEAYAVREAMLHTQDSQKKAARLLSTTPSIIFNAVRRMKGEPVRPGDRARHQPTPMLPGEALVSTRRITMPKNEPTPPDVVTVETLPLGDLIALAEQLYRSQHAPLRSQTSPEWLVEREHYLRVERELNERIEQMTEPVMVALYRALLAEDIDTLDNAADAFRALPPIAQRWGFAFWPVDPEENDGGDVEPARYLDAAIELRRIARKYASKSRTGGKKGAKE